MKRQLILGVAVVCIVAGGFAVDALAQTEKQIVDQILELKRTQPENLATGSQMIALGGSVVDVGQMPGAAPAAGNDTCGTAIQAVCGTQTGSNVGAATSGEASCGLADDQSSVWYLFTAPGSGNLEVTTCSGATNYDTELALYGGTCPGVTCIAGNDDDFTCASNILHSRISGAVTQGTDYWIMVDGFAGLQGDYELTIDCSALTVVAPTTPPWGLVLLVLALVAGGLLILRRGRLGSAA